MEEVDFSKLPLSDRLDHSAWKARQSAYDESRRKFEASQSDQDPCFSDLHARPDALRKWVLDPNVVAQETALGAIVKYLEFGGTHHIVSKLVAISFVSAVCEKGLALSRKNTREYANEVILLMVELSKDPSQVIEEMLPSLQGRVPKAVAACVSTMALLVEQFGCGKVISPRLLIPVLPKLFAHADRNVRAEATRLATAMHVWIGPALDTVLLPELKPIQQKDLTKAFLLVTLTDSPVQLRLTREQREEQEQQHQQQQQQGASSDGHENMDIDMSLALADIDPYEFLEPVNVLLQIPPSFQANTASAKWKDRKDALDEVRTILTKAKKMVISDDYSSLIRILAKCMKDANLMVVQEASTCTELLVKGIGHAFTKYTPTILGPMLERTKEKKVSVASAIQAALDAIFVAAGLPDVLEEVLLAMRHKTPQVKIASTNYLQRCLASTKKAPSRLEVEQIMAVAVPLLSDSMEAVRQSSIELVGTLMQITGPRPMNAYLEKVDEARKTKISAFANLVAVNCKAGTPQPLLKQAPKPSLATPHLRASSPPNPSSVPSKRGAVSPAKRAVDASKMTSHGRGLAGRSFASTPLFKPASPASVKSVSSPPPPPPSLLNFAEEEKQELELLRLQKQQWLVSEKTRADIEIRHQDKIRALVVEKAALTDQSHSLQRNYEMAAGMLKQRESQLENLASELENARVKIRELELNIRKMQVDRNGAGMAQNTLAAPEPRVTTAHHELSSRVTQLALDSHHDNPFLNKPSLPAQASPGQLHYAPHPASSPRLNFDNDNDSWRRAEEITSEMKARLETLKARSRATMSPVRRPDIGTRSID